MMSEFAGELSERVRFERRLEQNDGAGGRGTGWIRVADRWAMVEMLERQPLSTISADTRLSARQWRITLRGGLLLSLDMRCLWRNLTLRLTGIDEDPARPDRVVIWAEELGA